MNIVKAGKQIIGARFNSREQKAFDIEISKAIAAKADEWGLDTAALVLWVLHEEFGFGYERLKRYFTKFDNGVINLTRHYELDDSDDSWICAYKLKNDLGIDLNEWRKELRENEGQQDDR